MLRALTGAHFQIENLSEADDTQVLQAALNSQKAVIDIGHAGTAMRFLTAHLALTGAKGRTLTGSERMQQRPIAPLVTALQSLGAYIDYAGVPGYPPLVFHGKMETGQNRVELEAGLSSQYASALLLAGAGLPQGLQIDLKGSITSRSYINLTLHLMQQLGISCGWASGQTLFVRHGQPTAQTFVVEGDWSAASYWFSACGLSQRHIALSPLWASSQQPDRALTDYFAQIGVQSHFEGETLHLVPVPIKNGTVEIDFGQTPDIAQTLMVYCAARGIGLRANGLHTLRLKETDRIAAMQTEMARLGGGLNEVDADTFEVLPFTTPAPKGVEIHTYHDHRMALAFAPLQASMPNLTFQNPEVVTKSYPGFWMQWALFNAEC